MQSSGSAIRVTARRKQRNTINVHLGVKYWNGRRCIVTEFDVNGDEFFFYISEEGSKPRLNDLEKAIANEICADLPQNKIINNLKALGSDLTSFLLQQDNSKAAEKDRQDLAKAISKTKGTVTYRLGGPIPVELLTFPTAIGGSGPFDQLLGGRPAARAQSGTRERSTNKSEAIFFHDDMIDTYGSGKVKKALEVGFKGKVLPHGELLKNDLNASYRELERLFQGDIASWAHFQCHSLPDTSPKKIRLTNNFEVDRYRFSNPGPHLVAIMINTCSASRLGAQNAEGSWSEYFAGECGIPVVIGPICEVIDNNTTLFTEKFYQLLRKNSNIFSAFTKARHQCLISGDYTALVYRYVGPTSVLLKL